MTLKPGAHEAFSGVRRIMFRLMFTAKQSPIELLHLFTSPDLTTNML